MHTDIKIKKLTQALEQVKGIVGKNGDDPNFVAWAHTTKLALQKIYNADSQEYRIFNGLAFGTDKQKAFYSDEEIQACYDKDLTLMRSVLKSYLEDLVEEAEAENKMAKPAGVPQDAAPATPPAPKKVFISHASADATIVDELIDILKLIGLRQDQIFCTSIKGYGIPLGENFLDRLKAELNDDVLVLFVLSDNFYRRAICIAEMGAAWALTKQHVPLIVPPFTFDMIKGVIPLTQGMVINDKHDINALSQLVEKLFNIPNASGQDWERSRDKVLATMSARIKAAIATAPRKAFV